MPVIDVIICAHCKGTGRCQCDECQTEGLGQVYSTDGHYTNCSVCGGAGKVAVDTPNVECQHCNGTGRCQCDGCQVKAFGQHYSSSGHYCRCKVCNGSGKAPIRYIPHS